MTSTTTQQTIQSAQRAVLAVALSGLVLAAILGLRWWRPPAGPVAEGDTSPNEAAGNDTPAGSSAEIVRLTRAEIATAAGIEVASAEERTLGHSLACNGHAEFNGNAYVKVPPKAAGILDDVKIDVGAVVAKGDVLAVVDSQTLGDLKASLLRAKIHEEHSRWLIGRYQEAGDGIRLKDLFEEQHLLEEELTETRRIVDRLKEMGFSPEQIENVISSGDTSIQLPVVAPRGGTIVYRQAVEGEPVETTTVLFAIADLQSMWLHLSTHEDNLARVHLGQRVTFVPDGLPQLCFGGKVTWISPEIEPRTRTVMLRAEMENRDGNLRANMFGRAELLLDEPRPRLVVPQSAVQTHAGGHVVFVRHDANRFEARAIRVGIKNDFYWEVTAGLNPGELVATEGSFLLKSNLENPDFGKVE